MCYVMLCGTVT